MVLQDAQCETFCGGIFLLLNVIQIHLCWCFSLDNKVEMTAPVLMKMENQHKYFWQKKVFSMSFLLPSKHQASPPAPTDDKVTTSDKSWQQPSGFQVYFPIANYEPLLSCRWKLWRCQLSTCTYGALEDGWRACLAKAKQKRCPLPSIQLVQSTRQTTTIPLDITGDWIDTILPKGQRKPPIFVFFNKLCLFACICVLQPNDAV